MTSTSTQPSEVATAALDTRPLARHWRMPHSELLAELVAEGIPFVQFTPRKFRIEPADWDRFLAARRTRGARTAADAKTRLQIMAGTFQPPDQPRKRVEFRR